MKYIVCLLLICSSLFAFSDEELLKQLPQEWQSDYKTKVIENYKKYGETNQSILEYEKNADKRLTDFFNTKVDEAILDKYFPLHGTHKYAWDYNEKLNKNQEQRLNAISHYKEEIGNKFWENKPLISFSEWLEKRAYKLENLGSKLQSYYAMLNAIDTKQSYEKNAKELGLELTKESFINTMLSSHFNEYELNKNNDNETIVKDKALGLSANVGDIESFNYYTLKAFV